MELINKTMDRDDLGLPGAEEFIRTLNVLINSIRKTDLAISAWSGKLMTEEAKPQTDSRNPHHYGNYTPLPGAADDAHFPWFLYWEIFWTLRHTPLRRDHWILDAGGACSLFSCFLAQLGYRVISIELDEKLVNMANLMSRKLGWNMISIVGDISNLNHFGTGMFDVIFSICVFEHLDHKLRRGALREFGRVLQPGGYLSITFDYKNPRPGVWFPQSPLELNLISTPEQIRSNLVEEEFFEIRFNEEFHDNGKLYLGHPKLNYSPYTFGALFLQRR